MEKKSYTVSDIYQGGYSSLNPDYGAFIGYRTPVKSLGLTTDPRTANILQEASSKLSTGLKQIEISAIQPDIFESIPKQQLKEVNRLSKLTGVDISVHGPLIEPSGIGKEGGFNEASREEAERQLSMAVERSHEINPDGNIPVTFHSSATFQGPHYKKTKEGEEIIMMPIIDQDSGKLTVVQQEVKHYPGMSQKEIETGRIYSVKEQLESLNSTQWEDALNQLISVKERTNSMITETQPLVQDVIPLLKSGRATQGDLTLVQQDVLSRYKDADQELNDIHRHLRGLFDKAYKYGSDDDKEHLKQLSEKFTEKMSSIEPHDLKGKSRIVSELMGGLERFHPEQFKPLEDFAADNTAKTFGNVAWNTYQKAQKEKWKGMPVISIENPPAGGGLSRGEDLKKVVEKARNNFIEKAKSEGISESQARQQAEKLIGVTWDVGHINMLRRYGYTEEDVVKETKEVAPFLKHVHLSDNFGFEHTELPMGMGNVPLKEMMGKLGEKGFEAKKIIEAANWWQHFKSAPVQESFEAFGSPIYAMKNAPYWNQSPGFQEGYFSGYGSMLPQINYETFGSGFSQLPTELGGQRPGGQGGRMSGRPME